MGVAVGAGMLMTVMISVVGHVGTSADYYHYGSKGNLVRGDQDVGRAPDQIALHTWPKRRLLRSDPAC